MLRNDPFTASALAGVRIVVLRSESRGSVLATALRDAGATVTDVSLVRGEWLDPTPLVEAVGRMDRYDWVLLTSAYAVQRLSTTLGDARPPGACKLAVVGDATQDAVVAMRWPVTMIPDRVGIDGLIDALAARSDVDGARMLYVCADGARDVLPAGLRALGAIVDVVPVYRTTVDADARAQLRALVAQGAFDLVTVTAPGSLDALLEAIPPEHVRRVMLACVGPMAARAARKAGFPVKVEAESAAVPVLVRRIIAAFRSAHD
ncbi:MAG: uroporphyrinogen-III synthase [Gemmatimonas sp.]